MEFLCYHLNNEAGDCVGELFWQCSRCSAENADSSTPVLIRVKATLKGDLLLLDEAVESCAPSTHDHKLCFILHDFAVELVDTSTQQTSGNGNGAYPFCIRFMPHRKDQECVLFAADSESERVRWIRSLSQATYQLLVAESTALGAELLERFGEELHPVHNPDHHQDNPSSPLQQELNHVNASPLSSARDAISSPDFSALYSAACTRSFRFLSSENEHIMVEELMAEPKLSTVTPAQYMRFVLHWLERRLSYVQNIFYLGTDGVLENVRQQHIKAQQRVIHACKKALLDCEHWRGAHFKPSCTKEVESSQCFPTNVHLQRIAATSKSRGPATRNVFTSGAFTNFIEGFRNGGLLSMRQKLLIGLQERGLSAPAAQAFMPEVVWDRLAELGELQNRLSFVRGHLLKYTSGGLTEFNHEFCDRLVKDFGDLIAKLRTFGDREHLEDTVDLLSTCHETYKAKLAISRQASGGDQSSEPDFEMSALETMYQELEAQMSCVLTKLANLETVKFEEESEAQVTQWIADLRRSALDVLVKLEKLQRALQDAFMVRFFSVLAAADASINVGALGFMSSTRSRQSGHELLFPDNCSPACALFYRIEWRQTIVMCQAVSALLAVAADHLRLYAPTCDARSFTAQETLANGQKLVIVVNSYLSCFRNERCMLEDMCEILRVMREHCTVRLVRSFSHVSSAVPVFDATPFHMCVLLPLPMDVLDALLARGPAAGNAASLSVQLWPVLFTQGINDEQSLAITLGTDLSLERAINQDSFALLDAAVLNYLSRDALNEANADDGGLSDRVAAYLRRLMHALRRQVSEGAARSFKNVEVLHLANEISDCLGTPHLVNCKSGKDRTSMAVTLEEAHFLQRRFDLPEISVPSAIAHLRRDGTRRENIWKNAQLTHYAFSAVQVRFLPELYRPPQGCFRSGAT